MRNFLHPAAFWILGSFAACLMVLLIVGVIHPAELDINIPGVITNTSSFNKAPVNILFLGVAGNGSRGALLTDTILIAHLNSAKKQIGIIFLPRDLWVQIPNSNRAEKINALYSLSNKNKFDFSKAVSYNLIQEKIENITGLKINYVIIFELQGFSKLVDSLGGINIWLDKEMIDPQLVNPYNTSEIFSLKPGWNYLDGAMAKKFVRTRYSPDGDFYRTNNQHLIIAVLLDKISQLNKVWNLMSWLKVWQSISGHYITNLDFGDTWEMFKSFKDTKINQIKYVSITNRPPDSLLMSSSVPGTYEQATTTIFILLPKIGFERYQQIQEYIKNSLND